MKGKFALLVLLTFIVFSCSTDGEEDAMNVITGMEDDVTMDGNDSEDDSDSENDSSNDDSSSDDEMTDSPLVGVWVFNELRLEDGENDIVLRLLASAINDLVENECDLITFNFMDDGNVEVASRINDLDVSSTALTCPENVETGTGQWVLQDDILTLSSEGEENQEISIVFEDKNTLIIPGENAAGEELMEIDFEGSEAVFVRVQS